MLNPYSKLVVLKNNSKSKSAVKIIYSIDLLDRYRDYVFFFIGQTMIVRICLPIVTR